MNMRMHVAVSLVGRKGSSAGMHAVMHCAFNLAHDSQAACSKLHQDCESGSSLAGPSDFILWPKASDQAVMGSFRRAVFCARLPALLFAPLLMLFAARAHTFPSLLCMRHHGLRFALHNPAAT